jgi:hypothetical protein
VCDDKAVIKFPLPLKNYNDLRIETLNPRILILVLVPDNINDWLHHSEAKTELEKCGYWLSLLGKPETENRSNVTVSIPYTQMLDTRQLKLLLDKTERGETL